MRIRLTPSQLTRLVDEARVAVHARHSWQHGIETAADKRHVTFDTEQASFDGTMHLEADLEIPDALALAEAVASGAERLAKLGSTDTVDGRRATALGDLARHQMAFGFDDDDADDTGVGCEPASLEAHDPDLLYAHLSADAITHSDTPTHRMRRCVGGSSRPANGSCRWTRSAPGAGAPTCR